MKKWKIARHKNTIIDYGSWHVSHNETLNETALCTKNGEWIVLNGDHRKIVQLFRFHVIALIGFKYLQKKHGSNSSTI